MIDFNFIKSQRWCEIYSAAEKAIKDNKMDVFIKNGVIVGFSGGADSVTLLLFLVEYRKRNGYFHLAALHVNHMIRGDEANEDENFSKQICDLLNVPFFSEKIDIPKLSKESHKGLEETARDARYLCFERFITAHAEYNTVATAHNATDNLETVIFNMMRGTGINGLSGISPVRENIIRPLIYVPSGEIRALLNEAQIDFAVDSTNLSVEYTRNYIRHEILPRLSEINPFPERMVSRLSLNLTEDAEFIDLAAERFMAQSCFDGIIPVADMMTLHKALLFRVVSDMMKQYHENCKDGIRAFSVPERSHVEIISSKLATGDFSYCLPGGISFVSHKGKCFISDSKSEMNVPIKIDTVRLSYGLNTVSGFSTAVLVSESKEVTNYLNVYKIAIQKAIPFDIINGSLCVRSRIDGDSYKYGGFTHKIKKIFNDRKIPLEYRESVPIFCDETGIIWIPGFSLREGKVITDKKVYITILEPIKSNPLQNRMYLNLN